MKQLTDSTWVLQGPTNIGFIEKDNEVILIDSGNDKESGRKINKILKDKKWKLKAVLNTHSNADHIGGNDYLRRNLNCEIYATELEDAFIKHPKLETAFLWGGLEVKDLRNKFFQAKASQPTRIIKENEELEFEIKTFPLKGHFMNMIGVMSSDNVAFLADSIFGSDILEKYSIPFIFDVAEYKNSIQTLKEIKADYFVPSHGKIENDIMQTADKNLETVEIIEKKLVNILKEEKIFESVLKEICDSFNLSLNAGQYALVGSTIKSFLSYLYDIKKIEFKFEENLMLWKSI